MPKVSVIVPVYNTEKYLAECIESILNQTLEDLELILVNDGSTDKSGLICDTFAKEDSRIKVIHQDNGGVCAARNIGLDNSIGEFVFFVDSDDYIPNDTIKTLYDDCLEQCADISIGLMASESDTINTTDSLELWTGDRGLIESLKDTPALYGCCNKLFRRDLISDIRFVVGKKVHEDGFFVFLALIKLPKISLRNKSTYIYRDNPTSSSHAPFSDKYFDVLYFEERKRHIIIEKFPHLVYLAYNKLVKANLTMLHLFCKTKDPKYKKDVKKSIKAVRKYSKFFIPKIAGEKKFFLIVKYGGYPIFRRLYWIKNRKSM